jgi:hypothetical protein
MDNMNNKEWVWRELDKDLDLYKFYLELLLKAGGLILGVTGAITSYYFANDRKQPLIVYSLLLPLIVNGGFCLICAFGVRFAEILRKSHYKVCADAGATNRLRSRIAMRK